MIDATTTVKGNVSLTGGGYMELQIVEIKIADIPPEEVEERRKTFMRLMGKAFVNSARENMKKEREAQEAIGE